MGQKTVFHLRLPADFTNPIILGQSSVSVMTIDRNRRDSQQCYQNLNLIHQLMVFSQTRLPSSSILPEGPTAAGHFGEVSAKGASGLQFSLLHE